MPVRFLRAFVATMALAGAARATAQFPTYDDGSEADVYYYSAEDDSKSEYEGPAPTATDVVPAANHDAGFANHRTRAPMPPEPFEPGVVEPSSYSAGGNCAASASGCGDDCCNGCDGCYELSSCDSCCCKPRRFYARGEYLMWWMSGATAPPLATTSPDGTPIDEAGVLPDAEILFPTERLGIDGRPGGRFTLGYWLNDCETWGIEGNYFFLDKGGDGFQQQSDDTGSPILARPFFNTQTGEEDSIIVAYPDFAVGTLTIASASDILGAEANLRKRIWNNCDCTLDLLGGYRFLQVHESLSVYENQVIIEQGGQIPFGTAISIQDNFITRNEYHGGQVGMVVSKQCCRWTFEALGKVAFGSWNQQVRIGGYTSVTVPNTPTVVEEGGILALASNSGFYEQSRFATIPELDLNLRYQLTDCWRINVGYTFIYLPNIVRPGNNIDLDLDPDQFPPPLAAGTFPQFNFKQSDAWLQGLNVGVECRF